MSNEPSVPATAKGTRYVILSRTTADTYQYMGVVASTSSDAAIRKYALDSRDEGTFVAIAQRSFVPREVEQTVTVKLG